MLSRALYRCSVFFVICLLSPVLSLAETGPTSPGEYPKTVRPSFPLSTQGRSIIDADGKRFRIKAVNWYGAHLSQQVVGGLDKQPLAEIIRLIEEWGFNAVRLPFSNQMLHDPLPVKKELIAANPQFDGMNALQIFDRTVEALNDSGLAVILNNHTTSSAWCCQFDGNGLWYQSGIFPAWRQSTQQWEQDWLELIQRYRELPGVVGADLRNEVRTSRWAGTILPVHPNWGSGDANDWHRAAEHLARKIQQIDPEKLIIVEGINWSGTLPILGSGHRPVLRGAHEHPIRLLYPHKLVYAAHNYAYTGPEHNGNDKLSAGKPHYSDFKKDDFRKLLHEEWGYLMTLENEDQAPVILSEFGIARITDSEKYRAWFAEIVELLQEEDIDFAYWPLNHEDFGLVAEDWSHNLYDDWRYPFLQRLLDKPHPQ